jgi:hypothetical protein
LPDQLPTAFLMFHFLSSLRSKAFQSTLEKVIQFSLFSFLKRTTTNSYFHTRVCGSNFWCLVQLILIQVAWIMGHAGNLCLNICGHIIYGHMNWWDDQLFTLSHFDLGHHNKDSRWFTAISNWCISISFITIGLARLSKCATNLQWTLTMWLECSQTWNWNCHWAEVAIWWTNCLQHSV